MIKIQNFEPRLYQNSILETAKTKNTLVILGTGLGKTNIGLLLAINRLNEHPNSKILFLTPTKPLADQITKVFRNNTDLPAEQITLFTGSTPPEKRETLWKTTKIAISTPQGLTNDVINSKINLKEVSALIIDEAHRAVGNYDYVFLAKQYQKLAEFPRILALTASPGSDLEKITEVCKNLKIEDLEIRTEEDEDVKPYIQETELETINVDLPENYQKVKNFLEATFKSKLKTVQEMGYINTINIQSKKDLLALQAALQGKILRGEKDFMVFKATSIIAEAIKTHHAIELLETQGIKATNDYIERLYKEAEKGKVKATKNLTADINFKSARILTQKHLQEEHPKITELRNIIKEEVKNNPSVKIIVFNQYRDSAKNLEKELNELDNINAKLFVGQQKKNDTGLSQKEQIEILEKFKEGIYNCIIGTSVSEEGIDIPRVDLVIFYEPIPSAIRSIQRRGRTGRQDKGRAIILITKNTRDERYHWTAYHKEKKMHKILKDLKEKLKFSSQQTLENYTKAQNIKIIADSREKGSGIIKKLADLNLNIEVKHLEIADYIVSERVGIEFKTKPDFINSIIDKRLLQQIRELKKNFERPLIIVQGEEDIYSIRRVHPNAIRGMLATIAVSYQIPILYTTNPIDTAELIKTIARREQDLEKKDFGVRLDKKPLTTKEQQEFIIESLPYIGPTLAKSLLKEFKTIKKITNAKEEQLKKVDKLGSKKAKEIIRIINEEYKE